MSGEYIDVREGPKEALAEMHLIELLQDLARNVQEALRDLTDLVRLYAGGSLDVVRTRHQKIRTYKEASEEAKSKVVEYIVRISPTMVSKEMYAMLAYNLERLAQYASGAANRLAILATKEVTPRGEISKSLEEIATKLFEEYEALRSGLMMMSLNVKKVMEHCEKVFKLEEEIDEVYRRLEFNMFEAENVKDLVKVILLKDLAEVLEESSDVIRQSAESLVFMALHKLS